MKSRHQCALAAIDDGRLRCLDRLGGDLLDQVTFDEQFIPTLEIVHLRIEELKIPHQDLRHRSFPVLQSYAEPHPIVEPRQFSFMCAARCSIRRTWDRLGSRRSMPPPARRIESGAHALRRGVIQHCLDPLAHPACRLELHSCDFGKGPKTHISAIPSMDEEDRSRTHQNSRMADASRAKSLWTS